ncbi:MAG: hypothetical protein M1826_006051 [Phylliscum demangeonii]|nr:MAG: hypothetical protein M1826_006051 [Phylliscum demangeonii]
MLFHQSSAHGAAGRKSSRRHVSRADSAEEEEAEESESESEVDADADGSEAADDDDDDDAAEDNALYKHAHARPPSE